MSAAALLATAEASALQVGAAVLGSSPSPTPGLDPGLDPDAVTPGVPGFLSIFVLALVCIALFVGMTRRIRRIQRSDVPGSPAPGARPRPTRGAPGAGPGEPPSS